MSSSNVVHNAFEALQQERNALDVLNICMETVSIGEDANLLARFNKDSERCLYNASSRRCRRRALSKKRDPGRVRAQLDWLSQRNFLDHNDACGIIIRELAYTTCCCTAHGNGLIELLQHIEIARKIFYSPPAANLRSHTESGLQIRPVVATEQISVGIRFSLHPRNKGIPSSTIIRREIEKKAREDIHKGPKKGVVHAYCRDSHPEYTKIGHTTQPLDKYLSRKEGKCGVKQGAFKVIYQSPQISHPERIEYLIHEELGYYRQKLESCPCQHTHLEWFKVPELAMLLAITRWVDWVRKEPYKEIPTAPRWKWTWTFQETVLISFSETLNEMSEQLDLAFESESGRGIVTRRTRPRRQQKPTSRHPSTPGTSNDSPARHSTNSADPEGLQSTAEQPRETSPVTPPSSPPLPALTPDISESPSETPLSTPTPSSRSPVLSYITGLIWPQAGSLSPGSKANGTTDEDPFLVTPPKLGEEALARVDRPPRRPTLPMPGEWPRYEL